MPGGFGNRELDLAVRFACNGIVRNLPESTLVSCVSWSNLRGALECADSRAPMSPVGRISLEHIATALRKVQSMDLPHKTTLIDEIYLRQPNLLASCVVRGKLGADEQTVELLLNILLVCYLAMQESGYEWPLITEAEQAQQLGRTVGAVLFSEELTDPIAAAAARAQYMATYSEQPLLAWVLSQCTQWLHDLARRNAEKESDKFVMMASINLVNCIAHSAAQPRRAS